MKQISVLAGLPQRADTMSSKKPEIFDPLKWLLRLLKNTSGLDKFNVETLLGIMHSKSEFMQLIIVAVPGTAVSIESYQI